MKIAPKRPSRYPKAVAEKRDELLKGQPIKVLARGMGIADSQIVRLLNGRARRATHILIRDIARALKYKSSDEFYARLEELWKTMDRTRGNAA